MQDASPLCSMKTCRTAYVLTSVASGSLFHSTSQFQNYKWRYQTERTGNGLTATSVQTLQADLASF
jgi:hypothetical protein